LFNSSQSFFNFLASYLTVTTTTTTTIAPFRGKAADKKLCKLNRFVAGK
jgi:hypothetical protein